MHHIHGPRKQLKLSTQNKGEITVVEAETDVTKEPIKLIVDTGSEITIVDMR